MMMLQINNIDQVSTLRNTGYPSIIGDFFLSALYDSPSFYSKTGLRTSSIGKNN
jgi:hypothetical protein